MFVIPKKWRELPLDKKLNLPVSYFGFKKSDVERIRAISDRKKRIIESARLQFEKFGDIHSFLVAWIAGYGSDLSARQDFGSMRDLRALFVAPPKKVDGVEFSWSDLRRGVKIPDKITPELAEETGIHLGDGCLSHYFDKKGYECFRGSVTGDMNDESIYHNEFIVPLIKSIYNLNVKPIKRERKNSIETQFNSKAVVLFKHLFLGLPFGTKKDAKIPEKIFKNDTLAKRCLVGIFDTDFHITSSLSISGKLHSLKLAEQVHKILERNGIKHIYRVYSVYARFYIPKEFAKIIVEKWGMHNKKHLSKFWVYERFKVSIPFSTTKERLDLIDKRISLGKLKKISEDRRKKHRLLEDSNLRHPD